MKALPLATYDGGMTRQGLKHRYGLLVLMALLPWAAGGRISPAQASSGWVGRVEYVVDGDTVHVRSAVNGELHKVRVLGIDAPEICQNWGQQAKNALAGRVSGRQVAVHGSSSDDYKRLLATLWLDGQDVGAWMVAQGHAWSYRRRDQTGTYDAQENAARRQSLGLFSQAGTERPHVFRRLHGSCYLH